MNKITDLMDRLERVKLAREQEPEPDPLSVSLMQFEQEMSKLDDEGIIALTELTTEDGNPILTLEQARTFALSYSR